jgi:hypothetical protein
LFASDEYRIEIRSAGSEGRFQSVMNGAKKQAPPLAYIDNSRVDHGSLAHKPEPCGGTRHTYLQTLPPNSGCKIPRGSSGSSARPCGSLVAAPDRFPQTSA